MCRFGPLAGGVGRFGFEPEFTPNTTLMGTLRLSNFAVRSCPEPFDSSNRDREHEHRPRVGCYSLGSVGVRRRFTEYAKVW